jgi:LmbE family N-acetylglucosaminyl deacetylase
MNLFRLKKIAQNTKKLVQLLSWREVRSYIDQGGGLELAEFNPSSVGQRVLVFAPHTSDEIFGCGGMLIKHSQHRDEIKIVYLTDGSRGNPSNSRDKSLTEIREKEAGCGIEIIGGAEALFWRFADGSLEDGKTISGLAHGLIDSFNPSIIYLPWFINDESDYTMVMRIVYQALRALPEYSGEIWQYEIWTPLVPNRLITIGDVIDKKIDAMEAHKSQLKSRRFRDGTLGLNAYRGSSAGLDEPAEAYFALSADMFKEFCKEVVKIEN